MAADRYAGHIVDGGLISVDGKTLAAGDFPPGAPLVAERADGGLLLLPAVPDARRVYVEPTTQCNLACTTCIRHSWDAEARDMDFALFRRLVNELRSFPSFESAHFAGFGEPLRHPHIFDMLGLLRQAGIRSEMTTNGLLLDEVTGRRLIESGLGTLIVSVDGVEPATYGAIRSGADLPQVLHNLRRMARLRVQVGRTDLRLGVEFVAMRGNYHEVPDLLRLAGELGLDYVLISNLLPYSKEMAGQALYGNGGTEIPIPPWYPWFWGMERLRLPQMRLRTERLCRFVERSSFVVAADGKVSPCYPLMHTHAEHLLGREKQVERWVVGDLTERSAVDIWTSPAYVRFRARVRRFAFPSCPDCQTVDGCYFSQSNAEDCWANTPTCADCLWSRGMILCF